MTEPAYRADKWLLSPGGPDAARSRCITGFRSSRPYSPVCLLGCTGGKRSGSPPDPLGLSLSPRPAHLLPSLGFGEQAYGTDGPRRGRKCGSLIHKLALSWGRWRMRWFHGNWGRWCQDEFRLSHIGGDGLKSHWILHRYGMEFWLSSRLGRGRVW